MPIFEYQCAGCGHAFEELIRSADDASRLTCPSCGGRKIDRQLSVFAARHSEGPTRVDPVPPCGRCGDPRGSCSL